MIPPITELAAVRFEVPKIIPPASFDLIPPIKAEVGSTAADPTAQFARLIRDFEARPSSGASSFEDTTDYAVALIFVGRVAEAIKVLVALEAQRPGVYTTAANLGTAYELSGNLEAAVKWIGEGIARNPQSHDGTEWLHVAILRAKLKLRADQAWLAQHSVLDVAEAREPAEIVRAIEYQLNERLQFVRPSDAVVCDLFYQAAQRVAGADAKERKAQYLRESLRFGDWRKTAALAALTKG